MLGRFSTISQPKTHMFTFWPVPVATVPSLHSSHVEAMHLGHPNAHSLPKTQLLLLMEETTYKSWDHPPGMLRKIERYKKKRYKPYRHPVIFSDNDWDVQPPPKRIVFRFNGTILSFGEPGSLGNWHPSFRKQRTPRQGWVGEAQHPTVPPAAPRRVAPWPSFDQRSLPAQRGSIIFSPKLDDGKKMGRHFLIYQIKHLLIELDIQRYF